ncbi:MAG: hypothetical protein ACOCXG_00290 [Nanoarchaeota archaeon]
MEESKLCVLGNPSETIYYNLNKQYLQTKKIIITSDHLFSHIEESDIEVYLDEYSNSDEDSHDDTFQILKEESRKEIKFSNEFHKELMNALPQISQNMMEIQLKDYNFMNSINNAKFTITLRCESFSLNSFMHEKNTLESGIKNLFLRYIKYSGNQIRKQRLKQFQIEIIESEEIYKKIYMKKEADKLLLYASFGFSKENNISLDIGGEYYTTEGEKFHFYPNKQKTVIIKDHNKLREDELKEFPKVLENEELIEINKKTKEIDDAQIELYLNAKGQVKLQHVSVLENSLEISNEDGIFIYKSSKNYDRISLLTFRDNLDEQYPNPVYLVIKTQEEINRLFERISILDQLDGLIFTTNFYNLFLEQIGRQKDIDIIFWKHPLQKSLEVEFDKQNLDIKAGKKNSDSEENPFSNILSTQTKERDEYLEKLRNIDLSTPKTAISDNSDTKQIGAIATGIMSSKDSSMSREAERAKQGMTNSQSTFSSGFSSSGGGKKSAIGMLADSVLSNNCEPQKDEINIPKPQEPVEPLGAKIAQQIPEQPFNEPETSPISEPEPQRAPETNMGNMGGFDDMMNMKSESLAQSSFQNSYEPQIQQPIPQTIPQSQQPSSNQFNQSFSQKEELPYENKKEVQKTLNLNPSVNLSRYDDILATRILASPKITQSEYIFADHITLQDVREGVNLFYITTSKESMQDPSINYVLPINLNAADVKGCYLLINNIEDFFQIRDKQDVKYFINLSYVDEKIRENFLKIASEKFGRVSIIILKENLEIIENYIDKIENIFIKNLDSSEDYIKSKEKILSMEKRFLMKKLNENNE